MLYHFQTSKMEFIAVDIDDQLRVKLLFELPPQVLSSTNYSF